MSGARQLVGWESNWATTVDDLLHERKRRFVSRARSDAETPSAHDHDSEAARLTRAIEAEIIPRLMLAHRSWPRRADSPLVAPRKASHEDAAELARLSVAHEVSFARSFVDSLLDQGVTLDDILLEVLAPAAHLLGDLWARDLCRFTDVTVGLCRLQQLARDLAPDFERNAPFHLDAPRIALAPAPGEQHVFGLIVLEHYFRREGWNVWADAPTADPDLVDLVANDWIGAVGFTVSTDEFIEPLAALIARVRDTSSNPDLEVLVGGACARSRDDLAERVGASTAPADVHEAVEYLRRHLRTESSVRAR